MPSLDLGSLKTKAGSAFDGFTRGQKTMLALALGAMLVGGYLFLQWSSAPTYTALFSNLSAKDASEVTSQLTSQGVSYKLEGGGSTILVPRDRVYQLRLDLSAAGLPTAGAAGYSLLDKQGITTSEFRQRVDFQRALEGELSNTIGAIEGVSNATVHLVIPKDDLFSRDATKPTASVLLQTGSTKLSAGQVQGVVHLVAASVEGLDPTDVTVTDGTGRVLSSGDDGGIAAGDARTEQTAGFEHQLSSSLEDLLAPVVGAGRAVVKVKAAMDFDKKSTTSERFGSEADPQTVNEATSKETYAGTGPGGAAGILGPTGGITGAGSEGNYDKETAQRSFAVDKVTEQVHTAPGKVTRLTVAVLLDANAKNVDERAVTDLIAAAAGIDAARGDTVEVTSMQFDTSAADAAKEALEQEAAAERQGQMMGMIRTAGAVLLVALILFFAFRSARKATVQRVPMAIPLPPGEQQPTVSMAAMELPELHELPSFDPVPAPRELVPGGLADIIDNQPDDVAQMLRGWLADR